MFFPVNIYILSVQQVIVNTGSTCSFGQFVGHSGCNKAFNGVIFPVAAPLVCLVYLN